ncbi:hypothetical protein EsH8_VI_001099 [Colletotrichum jinshuiense]
MNAEEMTIGTENSTYEAEMVNIDDSDEGGDSLHDETDEEDDEGQDREKIEWNDTEYRWMLVSCQDLVCYWDIMSMQGEWNRQFGLFSDPEKHPWEEV